MTLTYTYLKAREAELPARINAKNTTNSTVIEVQVNPITGLDLFYSDGSDRMYCCKITVISKRDQMEFSRYFKILPDGDHLNAYGYRDPVHGDAIHDAMKALLFELDEEQAAFAAATAAAKIGEPASPVAGTAPIS